MFRPKTPIVPASTTANALATTTTSVNVSNAAAPTIGQVPVASSTTQIDWKGAEGILYAPNGANATPTVVGDVLSHTIWVTNYIGADSTGVTSSTAAFTSAGSLANYVEVHIPAGIWRLDTSPTPTGIVTWIIHTGAVFLGTGILPGSTRGWASNSGTTFTRGAGQTGYALFSKYTDTANAGAGIFLYGALVYHDRVGGTGHRQAFTSWMYTKGAAAGEMLVGNCGFSTIETGSGNAFGMNPVAQILSGASSTAEGCALESNTDIRRNVIRKVGHQIVDVNTSTGAGTTYDAGEIIGCQSGGVGYLHGIRFGFGTAAELGVKAGGTILYVSSNSSGALSAGIDLSNLTTAPTISPILLAPNTGGIKWGSTSQGGSIISSTTVNGMRVTFGNNIFTVKNYAGTQDLFTLDNSLSRFLLPTGGSIGQQNATTATSGYLGIPTCAGIPTGVPANLATGTVALQYDTTNNDLYVYNGSWKKIGLV